MTTVRCVRKAFAFIYERNAVPQPTSTVYYFADVEDMVHAKLKYC